MDPILQTKKTKGKKRHRKDIITQHLQLYEHLKTRDLRGVLLDAAVWICAEDDVVHKLDCLCLGNLDGGAETAEHVRKLLQAGAGETDVPGLKAVRLSLDEAFFMAYGLGCLKVHDVVDSAAVKLDIHVLWQRLQVARSDFLMLYLAYHHFRSKGWIPRTGLQYGVDFVLYQRHPALAHSDYSVLIQPVKNSGGGTAAPAALTRPPLSWHDLQVTNRLTGQVGKRLLLFYVQDNNGPGTNYSSPKCLAHFAVQERVVRRYVPEAQRNYKPQIAT
jgi:tRNA-intron lyase